MPPFSSRARASRRATAVLGAVGVLLSAAGVGVATAAPITPAYPTVFISQSTGSSTQLKQTTQSRLANAGAGGVEIANVGSAAAFGYNALAFRTADSYAYAISSTGQLVRVHHDGSTTQLGTIAIAGGGTLGAMYSGAFGEGAFADTYFVRPTNAGSTVYKVDVTTLTATALTLTAQVTTNDFTWAHGHLWGVQADKTVVRINPDTGLVTMIPAAALFTADDATQTAGYGAAWRYGNGNIAVSNNSTGNITQFTVVDAGTSTPSVTKVSTIRGPSTSQNDGTTTPSSPADLELAVASPAPAGPAAPITWTVKVTNDGPGGSSGSVVSFPVPTGVTDVVPPVGCTLAGGVVQCVTGALAAGTGDTFVFSAKAPPAGAVSATSAVTIVGNELDPVSGGATLSVTPLPTHLTSTGVGTAPQSRTATVPAGGTLALLDADGDPTTAVTVAGQGTYTAAPTTGVLTFTPVLGFQGVAEPVAFTVTTAGGSTTGDYTPTVTAPPAPAVGGLTTSGVSPDPQTATTPALPAGGSVTLLDADGDPATTVTVAGQGTYVLASGVITFTPAALYTGTATPVTFRVTDAYGQSGSAAYTPTVLAPAGPVALPLTSTGVAPAPQSPAAPITVPAGGGLTLLDADGDPAPVVVVPGEGTYSLDPATGTVTFTPAPGYTGTATPVGYRVTDAYAQSAAATYTPTVTAPPAPAAPPTATSGVGTAAQSATLPVPSGGSLTLLDADGDPATTVTVPGQGTYTLDPATGTVTFAPVLGFAGPATPVDYTVTDAYGQVAGGRYTPTVVPPAPPTSPTLTSTGPVVTPQQTTVPVPVGGAVTLLDGAGVPAASVAVPGVGGYALDPATGTVVFTPVFGFAGAAPGVPFRVTDAYGQTASGTYTPAVVPPAAPPAPAAATTEVGTTPHDAGVPVPTGGSVTLLDADGDPAVVVSVAGEGTYTLDPATGAITFEPVLGFHGPGSVPVRVTDAYGQSTDGAYTPTVLAPAAPGAPQMTSGGAAGTPQSPRTTVPVPGGGNVRLVDSSGAPATTVTVPGQGTYAVDPATGALTFTPAPGFAGTATAVGYRVTDAYGQSTDGTYTAVVAAAPAPSAPPSLPDTGGVPTGLAMLAVGLMLGGAALVLAVRRRATA